jgi:hypothetical protein
VQGVLWHEESGGRRLAARVAERVEGEAEVEIEDRGGSQGSDVIATLLAAVVRDVVGRFRAANVQVGRAHAHPLSAQSVLTMTLGGRS